MLNNEEFGKNLDRISDWIKAVDQKVAIFLAFQGVVLVGFLPVLFKVVINDYFLWHEYFIFLCIVSSVLLLYGTAKSIFTIMPKLKNHHKKSILYFRDISSMSVGDFKKKIGNLNEEEYEDCVLEQIHILSCVATKKHEQFRAAILIFFSGIILFLICLFIFF